MSLVFLDNGYTNWAPGFPDFQYPCRELDACVGMSVQPNCNEGWNDISCWLAMQYICEKIVSCFQRRRRR